MSRYAYMDEDDYLDAVAEEQSERQFRSKVRHTEVGSPDYYELTDEEDEE